MTDTHITGRLLRKETLTHSYNGNPRWEITLAGPHGGERTYRTLTDAAVGYDVDNHKIGRTVRLTLRRGAVVDMTDEGRL